MPSALSNTTALSHLLLLSQLSCLSTTLQKIGFTEKIIAHDKLADSFQIRVTDGFLTKMRSSVTVAVCSWWAVSGLSWQTPTQLFMSSPPLRGTTAVQYTQGRSLQLLGDPSRGRTLPHVFSALATASTPSTMLQILHCLS